MNKIAPSLPRFVYSAHIQTFFWNDRDYYEDHKDEIQEWAKQHNCKIHVPKYGWLEVPNDDVKLLFILRWS